MLSSTHDTQIPIKARLESSGAWFVNRQTQTLTRGAAVTGMLNILYPAFFSWFSPASRREPLGPIVSPV